MASENCIAAAPAPAAHPLAKPGYGKRSVPDQSPSRVGDFGHLPPREAYLASLLDRLCDNAVMDAKTIAKAQPLYGQQAVRSALNALSTAGHLRRVRRRVQPAHEAENGTRWASSRSGPEPLGRMAGGHASLTAPPRSSFPPSRPQPRSSQAPPTTP